jgi:hypothetical protein
MRLAIASVDAEKHLTILYVLREPVRLGKDVHDGRYCRRSRPRSEAFRSVRRSWPARHVAL